MLIYGTHPVEIFYDSAKYLLNNGENLGDIIECRNAIMLLHNYTETPKTKIMHDTFIEIFGDERLNWAKKVTFMEPRIEQNPFTDESEYKFECLPKDEKRDSYFGRLIGQCGGFERNQFAQIIKRVKEKKNSKTCQMVIFKETDIFNSMSQPCCLSINLATRDEFLHISANWRSMAVSKAGYPDCQAIYEMGNFLAKESDRCLGDVTLYTHSCHLRHKDDELNKTKKFIETVDNRLKGVN
jgi:thymidylate synthase